jgi:hypothetical protein
LAGQWLSATYCFRVGIWAQAQYADDPWNLSRYPYFQNMLVDQALSYEQPPRSDQLRWRSCGPSWSPRTWSNSSIR